MELNNGEVKNGSSEPQKEVTLENLQQVFQETLKIGKYTYRLKQGLKGKELFQLCNTFTLGSGIQSTNGDEIEMQKLIYEKFGDKFDFTMSYLEYSVDGIKFYPVVINGVYQVQDVEINVFVMYKLISFVYMKIISFTQISQQLSNDMQ